MSENKRKTKYPVSPQTKHVRECVHEELTVRNGTIYKQKWLFKAEDFPCPACKKPTDVYFVRTKPSNTVVRGCEWCGVSGIVHTTGEKGEDKAQPIGKPKEISIDEARSFIRRNGMKTRFLDPALATLVEKRGRRSPILEE